MPARTSTAISPCPTVPMDQDQPGKQAAVVITPGRLPGYAAGGLRARGPADRDHLAEDHRAGRRADSDVGIDRSDGHRRDHAG